MSELITFTTLPAPVDDQPAAERCLSTPPQRRTWNVYQGEQGAVDCGIWTCQPGAWRIAFHDHRHEFFHVLEGRLRITSAAGTVAEFGPGDACVIPAGFKGVFEVLTPVRKYYVMVDKP